MSGFEEVGLWLVRALRFLGVYVSSLAFMTLVSAAAPIFLTRIIAEARTSMKRCFLWGVVFVLNIIFMAGLAAQADGILGPVVSIAAIVILLLITLHGMAAIGTEIGRRVLMLHNKPTSSTLAQLYVGTTILFLTALIPILGWLILAGALFTGIGAFLESAVGDYTRPG